MNLIQYIISSFINVTTSLYVVKKVLKNNNKKFKLKEILFFIMLNIFLLYNFLYVPSSIRILISTFLIIIFSKMIFQTSMSKIIVAVIIEQFILFVSELIYAILILLTQQLNAEIIFNEFFGMVIPNLIISIIAIILINNNFILNLCHKIMQFMENIKQKNKYIISLLFIITLNILLLFVYISSNNLIIAIINIGFIIIYSCILYLLLNEKNLNIKFKEENNILINNLNEYEKMLDYQRVSNHENKNQLLVIKTMVNKNNKKLLNYIDEIIKDKKEDNDILYTKAKQIPSGGLQGIIYQKMLVMQEYGINIILDIAKGVRKIDFSDLDSKTNYDICRAMGIIIDNAIDEVKNSKLKEISISMYIDEYFIIEVSNACDKVPDLEKIDNKGYTTKSKGHGYGLSLLKEICNSNNKILNERKIISNIFTQIIKIKM